MSDYTFGGAGIASAIVYHPARGAATGDIEVTTDEALTGQQTLSLPGLDLVCTIIDGSVLGVRQKLRVVGGRGGLGDVVEGQHFNSATVRTVVNYLLGKVGEQLDAQSDSGLLSQQLDHWQHVEDSAGRGLDLLTEHIDSTWYVTPAGDVHIGDHAWAPSDVEHVLIENNPRRRFFTISALDDTVQPGTTFLDERVSSVEHLITSSGARTIVRWGSDGHPYDEGMRDLVQHFQIFTMPAYEAQVVSQGSDGKLDLKPADPSVGPGWQKVRMALVGTSSVKLPPGAIVVVEFLDNNRSKPYVRTILEGSITEISSTATSKIEQTAQTLTLKGNGTASLDGPSVAVGGTATDVRLGKGTNFVAAQGDAVAAGAIAVPVNIVVKV